MNNGIIVLTFHEQDLTKDCGRGLHGPEPDARSVPGPARDFSNRPGRLMKGVFTNGRAGNLGDFSNGPGRQMKGDFSNGSGWAGKKEMSLGRVAPADLYDRPCIKL